MDEVSLPQRDSGARKSRRHAKQIHEASEREQQQLAEELDGPAAGTPAASAEEEKTSPSATKSKIPRLDEATCRVEYIPFELDAAAMKPQYEYLDHTADVQLHAWGATLADAFQQVGIAMFGYMTELVAVTIDPSCNRSLRITGHSPESLLYNYLTELLCEFATTDFIAKVIHIHSFSFRDSPCSMTVSCQGERFSLSKHPQGTEVKAITYSNMQIREPDEHADDNLWHIFVIIDI